MIDDTRNLKHPSRVDDNLVAELRLLLEQSNERLKTSQARLRTVLHSIPLGLFLATKDGIIQSASPACVGMFRCQLSDFISRDLQEMFHSDSTKEHEPLIACLNQPKEFTAKRADGSEFAASVTVTTFAGSRSRLFGCFRGCFG